MSRSLLAGFSALAGSLLLSAIPAGAQIAPGGGPVSFGSDGSSYSDAERILRLTGRAELIQAENRLRARDISVHYGARQGGSSQTGTGFGSAGDVERITAEGDVYFVTPTEVIRGDNAVYTLANDTIVFTGDVIVTRGQDVLTGSRLTVEVGAGRTTMDGQPTENGRRVRGVFYPENDGN